MHWCSAVSNSPSLELALEDVTKEILKKLDGKNPDLGFVFILFRVLNEKNAFFLSPFESV